MREFDFAAKTDNHRGIPFDNPTPTPRLGAVVGGRRATAKGTRIAPVLTSRLVRRGAGVGGAAAAGVVALGVDRARTVVAARS